MPQFLYFVPTSKPTLPAKELAAVGLGHLRIKGEPQGRRVTGGPGGKSGLIFAGDGSSASFSADQTWQAGPDAAYFVAPPAGSLPGPADLLAEKFVEGEPVAIGEQSWTIPICRSVVRGATLPRAMVLGADAKSWEFRELPEFAALCRAAERVWTMWSETQAKAAATDQPAETSLSWAEVAPIAVDALAVNYRVGPVEVSMLGLLTTQTMHDVLMAMIDYFELVRVNESTMQKKSIPDS